MTYEQLVQYFSAQPEARGLTPYGPEFNQAYNAYFQAKANQFGVGSFEELTPDMLSSTAAFTGPVVPNGQANTNPAAAFGQEPLTGPTVPNAPANTNPRATLGSDPVYDYNPGAPGSTPIPQLYQEWARRTGYTGPENAAAQQQFNEYMGGIAEDLGVLNDWTRITLANLDSYDFNPAPGGGEVANPVAGNPTANQAVGFDGLRNWFIETVPGGKQGVDTPDWNRRFNDVVYGIAAELGITDINQITGTQLADYTISGGGGPLTTEVPLEQGLLNKILPNLTNDIDADAGRRSLAQTLGNQLQADTTAARDQLQRSVGGGFNAERYFTENPDVKAAYDSGDHSQTPEKFAEWHYLQYGQQEGRTPYYTSSPRLAQEQNQAGITGAAISNSAQTSANQQLGNLNTAVTSMQGNLSGELAQRAAALDALRNELNTNLDAYDATQRAALEQQIATQTQALKQAIADRTTALETELSTNRGAISTQTAAQIQNLEAERAALGQANDANSVARRNALTAQIASLTQNQAAETTAKKASLAAEISSLQGSADAQSVAKRASLQQELDSLNAGLDTRNTAQTAALEKELTGLRAAQDPVNQSRLGTAEALTTGINLGLEETRDSLTAERARQGYVGSSTMDTAASTRAAIGARQAAASAMAQARQANAVDSRDIEARGATGTRSIADTLSNDRYGVTAGGARDTRSIADTLADNTFGIRNRGALEGRTIADADASGRRAIGDFGATDTRSISDSNAANVLGIANRSASGTREIGDTNAANNFSLTTYGSGANRSLADALATGQQAISNFGADSTRSISDSTGLGRANIGNNAATTGYNNALYGSDTNRSLLDSLATGTAGIGNTLAQQQQDSRDATSRANQTYFDNDYTRNLNSTLALPGLATNQVGALTALDNYGRSGTNSALDTLRWWMNQTQAPTAGTTPAVVDTTGNSIGNLGAALTGAALNVGVANNWGQKTPAQQAAADAARAKAAADAAALGRQYAGTSPNYNVSGPP